MGSRLSDGENLSGRDRLKLSPLSIASNCLSLYGWRLLAAADDPQQAELQTGFGNRNWARNDNKWRKEDMRAI